MKPAIGNSLTQKIEDYLMEYIASRNLQPGDRIPPLQEIAAAFGASTRPVRNALENLISKKVLDRRPGKGVFIRETAAGKIKTNAIGILYWSKDEDFYRNPFYSDVLAGVKLQAEKDEKMLLYKSLWNSYEKGTIKENVLNVARKVDGLLVMELKRDMQAEFLAAYQELSIPAVSMLADGMPGILDSFIFDHGQNVEDVINFLSGLGHSRISYIIRESKFHEQSTMRRSKLRAFSDTLAEAGLAKEACPVIYLDPADREDNLRQVQELLSGDTRPGAVMCDDDTVAFQVYKAAQSLNIKVPDDLTVVGYDDLVENRRVEPALTSVRLPLFEIGEQAIQHLLEKTVSSPVPEKAPVKVLLRGEIIKRDSHKAV